MELLTEDDGTTTSDTQPRKKFENNGKGLYYRSNDDTKVRYNHIFIYIYKPLKRPNYNLYCII